MESHQSRTPSSAEATDVLDTLADDRDRLAQNTAIPWPLLAGYGCIGAWWVAGAATTKAGADYAPPASTWLALVAVLLVSYLIRRETGVRFRAMGPRAVVAVVGIIVGCLALFSVSLGLMSFGMAWAVALTSVAAFALTTWLARVAYRSGLEQLRRD